MTDRAQNWLSGIVGLGIFGFGFYFLRREPPDGHSAHVYFFGTIAFVGALSIRPEPILVVLQRLSIVVAPFFPVFGERRSGIERRSGDTEPPKDAP